jgi:hypothetical protein
VWRDGTSHLLFEPIEFLEKLAAIIPRPAVNLLLYHDVLAPHARWRRPVVTYGRAATLALLRDPKTSSPPITTRRRPPGGLALSGGTGVEHSCLGRSRTGRV